MWCVRRFCAWKLVLWKMTWRGFLVFLFSVRHFKRMLCKTTYVSCVFKQHSAADHVFACLMENHFCNCLDIIHWRCNSVIGFACRHINTKIICKNCINAKPTRVSKQSGLWYQRDPSPTSLVLILGSAGPLWAFQLLLRSDRWALLIHDLWCMRRKASSSLFMSSELWFPLKETEPHIRFTFLWLLLTF